MNIKIWKKNAVLATVILFVCVAVYLNWSYSRGEQAALVDPPQSVRDGDFNGGEVVPVQGEDEDEPSSPVNSSTDDYFSSARLKREQARDGSISLLRETTSNESLSQESRDKASEDLNVLASFAISEANIENMVIAKGFVDCVAFISDTGVDIVVAAPDNARLQAEDVSRIKDIVIDVTGVETGQIQILEVGK